MDEPKKTRTKKTTFYIDPELLAAAKETLGAASDTETVHAGLRELVRNAAYERLRSYLGSEKGRPIYDVPRRRETPKKTSKARARRSA